MYKKFAAALAAATLVGLGVVGVAGPASATQDCVPSAAVAAYDDVIVDTPASDEVVTDTAAYDEVVVDTQESDQWYSWTGGPSDTHPFPSDSWQPDNGNHNGFPQDAGVYQRDKGNSGKSDWFYHDVIAETSHVVHHDAVTHTVHHDIVTHVVHHDAIPAVVCETPVPTISAAVTGSAVCNADGYDITWNGSVATENAGSYIAQRVKFLGTPVVTVQNGAAPGSGFSYTTHVAGDTKTASAPFHVHVTQTQAGVDPLDTDATGTVELKGDCVAGQPTTRTAERSSTDCEADTVTVYTDVYTTESAWDAESHSYVAGEETGPVTTSVTRDATGEECPPIVIPPIVVTPDAPTFHDSCGTTDDGYTLASGEGYIEEATWNEDHTVVTIRALASEGYTLGGTQESDYELSYTFTNEPCPTPTPSPSPQPTPPSQPTPPAPAPAQFVASENVLAHTGSDFSFATLLVSLGLILAGGIVGVAAYAHRRKTAAK